MKTKKLLAIILSLAMLIGLVPAAGLLTTAVAAENTDPTVYEIKFEGGQKFDVGYYTNSATDAVWNFTFEYYLDCESDDPFNFLWVSKDETNITGSYVLQKGRHTATFGATNSTNISPRFTAKTGMSGTLYVWNLKVTLNGADKAYYYHSPWLCEQKDHTCTRTTATVTSDKTYSEYDFENMGKDENKAAVTHAVQIRGDGGMRFISTVAGIGAVRNEDGTADYTTASITVDGNAYKVTTAGTLFARKQKLSDDGLIHNATGVYDIPAEKLQKAENAPSSIPVEDGDILFTGVITNIPESNRDETLIARAYVAYEKDGAISYVYGDVIERSYNAVVATLNALTADAE